MKLIKNKQSEDISIIQGGYSDVRLWPCYIIYSSLILFFAPIMGMALSVLLFTAIGFGVSLYAASRAPKTSYDMERWHKDFDIAYASGDDLPRIFDYEVVIPAKVKAPKPKKITTKKRAFWPYLDMPGAKS
ncbi:MAG: hypothetical protein QG593_673 [Patescibacteria group bacterium]|nr:hypothetical protein [Patescibacteria group bacterium]